MTKSTVAQRWSQKRFMAKGQVTGMRNLARYMLANQPLTMIEKFTLRTVLHNIEVIIGDWDYSNAESKEGYLSHHPTP